MCECVCIIILLGTDKAVLLICSTPNIKQKNKNKIICNSYKLFYLMPHWMYYMISVRETQIKQDLWQTKAKDIANVEIDK